MSWYVDAGINEGYPYNTDFLETYIADWTFGVDDVYYPIYSWRIAEGINDGYPFTWVNIAPLNRWWWDDRPIGSYAGSSGGVVMQIGGRQTNYPNGFTNSDRGGIVAQFDTTSMTSWGVGGGQVIQSIVNGLSGRLFAIDGGELASIVNYLNTGLSAVEQAKIQLLYGSNVYDGILVCKSYPFQLPAYTPTSAVIFGDMQLPINLSSTPEIVHELQFGSVTLDIKQAWEIENIDYSIYLPYAGTYPIDIRGKCTVLAKCYVDLYTGIGEYYVYIDNQLQGIYKCQMGSDVPLNFSQAVATANINSLILSTVSNGLPLVGGIVGGVEGAAVGGLVSGAMSSGIAHQQVSAPQVGSTTSAYTYPYVRIIAKIPKMFNSGYGYEQIHGAARSRQYTKLSEVSGFVRCSNFKTDIIVATSEEKREIERLLDEGVFV